MGLPVRFWLEKSQGFLRSYFWSSPMAFCKPIFAVLLGALPWATLGLSLGLALRLSLGRWEVRTVPSHKLQRVLPLRLQGPNVGRAAGSRFLRAWCTSPPTPTNGGARYPRSAVCPGVWGPEVVLNLNGPKIFAASGPRRDPKSHQGSKLIWA